MWTFKLNSIFILLVAMLGACKKEEDKAAEAKAQPELESAELKSKRERLAALERPVMDYPARYCEFAPKIKTRIDISEEIGFFCKDAKPTEDFIKFRTLALTQEPKDYAIQILKSENYPDDDRTEFWVIWAFRVPVRPFEVKSRPLYALVSKDFDFDEISFRGKYQKREEALDSGLHLWSYDMTYELKMKPTNTKTLSNSRISQYNLYQVESGSEEMGLGVDSVLVKDNPDFKKYILLNISFNDGGGYNDAKGGTIVIGYMHIDLKNQGFPKLGEKAMLAVAKHSVDDMYAGLQP